jgi:hypothetical protein
MKSSGNNYIPGPEAIFNTWQNNMTDYVEPKSSLFNIPLEKLRELMRLKTDYKQKYDTSMNPSTKTPAAILARQEARKTYEKYIRQFVKEYLAYNSLVSDEDRRNMGLPVHDNKPSPAPEVTTMPVGEVDFSVHQRHTLRVKDNSLTGKTRPENAIGFETWYKIGEAPASDTDFVYAGFSSSTKFVIDYPLEKVGQTVSYRFRWLNPRNQPGPWSEGLVTAIIA